MNDKRLDDTIEVVDPQFTPFTMMPNWAIGYLDPYEMTVFLVLRSYVSQGGASARPSIGSLAKRCLMSDRKVHYVLDCLEAKGVIVKQDRKREDGSSASNIYILAWEDPRTPKGEGAPHAGGGAPHAGGGCTTCTPLNNTNRTILREQYITPLIPHGGKRENDPSAVKAGMAKRDFEAWFEDFKAAYPKRSGAVNWAEARKKLLAMSKVKGFDPEAILDGARRYRAWADATGHTGTSYVPMASTWVNQHRWQEDYDLSVANHQKAVLESKAPEMSERERLALSYVKEFGLTREAAERRADERLAGVAG